MQTSYYRGVSKSILGLLLCFAWWMGTGTKLASARDHSAPNYNPAQTVKAADMAHNPTDLSRPDGIGLPAAVQVTLAPKGLGGVLDAESSASAMNMSEMNMAGMGDPPSPSNVPPSYSLKSLGGIIGCLRLQEDGKAMLEVFHSDKIYRLEAQPFLFGQNVDRLVRVTGHFGSVLTVEDPNVPSYVVDTVQPVEPNCSEKTSYADIQKALAPPAAPVGAVVDMSASSFLPATVTIAAGQQVVWKNSSSYYHNVMDDPAKALNQVDVSYPSGTAPFGSSRLQPGTNYYHVFLTPGVYRYVCTLHEAAGMKGTVIVKPSSMVASNRK